MFPRLDTSFDLNRLNNLNHRWVLHILFWVGYYGYRVLNYGGYVNTFENVAYVQFLELPIKLFAVYVNLYLLMPNFLRQGKTTVYAILVFVLLMIATFMQLQIIRICMELGIYNISLDKIFSVHRFIRAQWHISTIMFITAGIKILKDTYQGQQVNQQLEKEKLENELKFLKAQVNPHFFFNTLNSLYALILDKSDQAAEMLLKLSDLMHYMLYDTVQDKVALSKEVTYLSNYLELEKMRYGDELNVVFRVHGQIEEVHIVPMILIPLVENAFKHGLRNPQENAYIKIELSCEGSVIKFKVENSIPQLVTISQEDGGIGLKNLKRRLELLYKDQHELQLKKEATRYKALLMLSV